MFMRMAVTKATSSEQIVVDIPSWNPVTGAEVATTVEQMKAQLSKALDLVDERASETHARTLASYGLINYLPLEVRSMVIEILDVLTGQADAAYVVKKWQASLEETADLERLRAEHAASNGAV